jgi:hypothetical protein
MVTTAGAKQSAKLMSAIRIPQHDPYGSRASVAPHRDAWIRRRSLLTRAGGMKPARRFSRRADPLGQLLERAVQGGGHGCAGELANRGIESAARIVQAVVAQGYPMPCQE